MADAPSLPHLVVTIDEKTRKELMWTLASVPNGARKAMSTAINKTAAHGRSEIASAVSEAMGARISSVNKRITVEKGSSGDPSASINLHGEYGVSLIGFAAHKNSTGVVAKIFGEKKDFPHAFIQKALSGNKQVFEAEGEKRAMTKGRYAGKVHLSGPLKGQPILRKPLVVLKGPPVPETFEKTTGLAENAMKDLDGFLQKTLVSQVDWLLNRTNASESPPEAA